MRSLTQIRLVSYVLAGLWGLMLAGVPGWVQADSLVRVAGSTTVLPVLTRAAEDFMRLHPNVRITVNAGGSGVGIQSVGTGRVDIGMASREMTRKEVARYKKNGMKQYVIGRDAVACVVSSEIFDSGVQALSRQQIADIYLGRIQNWKEVGGPDRQIVVIDKERHRGTRHVFMDYVLGDPEARAPGARLVTGSNNEEQAKVAQSDAAIGMLSVSWVNSDVSAVAITDGTESFLPTQESVESGRYPIARSLFILVGEGASSETQSFVDFVLGPAGKKQVRLAGYLPPRGDGSHTKTFLSH